MKMPSITRAVNRYYAIVGMMLFVGMLVATIALTGMHMQWIIFLMGVIASGMIAFASHSANARWTIARRTSQLTAAREKLAAEASLRTHAETALSRITTSVDLVDSALPAMLAYVDPEGRVRYHNHAFARWLRLPRKSIDGQRLEDVLGRAAFGDVEPHLAEARQGHDVRFEGTQRDRNGDSTRFGLQFLPHFAPTGEVAGVFIVMTDITSASDLGETPLAADDGVDIRTELILAMENDEFSLYRQAICTPGSVAADGDCCEILLRLEEENHKHIPPGMFLPLAEELGLLKEIDRWVVRSLVDFVATGGEPATRLYFVNLAEPTIHDAGFATFVRDLLAHRLVDGNMLCFELPETEVLADFDAYREFVARFEGSGCRFAVSGFGCNPLALRLLRQLRVDFLKLDGGIVVGMLRNPAGSARVDAINKVAHAAGMRTIAECVEDDATCEALANCETDFVQGFGIERPRPLRAPAARALPSRPLRVASA